MATSSHLRHVCRRLRTPILSTISTSTTTSASTAKIQLSKVPSTLRIISTVPRQVTPFSTVLYSPIRCNKRNKAKSTKLTRAYVLPKGVPGAPRPPRNDQVKVLPFIFIFAAGSGTFYLLVQKRAGQQKMPAVNKQLPAPNKTGPTWSPKDVSVIFVLGGPGVGKGTQCANLVRDYGFVHLSAGDLLRAEQQRPGSEFGDLIKGYIKDGKIVPMEVTIALLQNAMRDEMSDTGKSKFLIDGFPREMNQAKRFEEDVVESQFTLFFDADEDIMMKRLIERGKTSGRSDDNEESIKKRFKTFKDTSYPVIEYYQGKGKVVKVNAAKKVDDVYGDVKKNLDDRMGEKKMSTQPFVRAM